MELTLTGEMIDAQRALEVGLVGSVVPKADLMVRAKELLRKVTKNGPLAVRMAMESIYRALDVPLSEAMANEASLFGLLASTDDMQEGMTAFLEKRKADFKGR
jgi:enoyl-CoA hydratase/carnithine racemase